MHVKLMAEAQALVTGRCMCRLKNWAKTMIWKPWALCSDDIGNYYYIYVKNSLFIRQNLKMSFWEPCQLPQTFQVSSCLWSFLGNPNIHILYPHMLTCPGFQGKNFNQRTLVEFLHDQPCVRSWTHCILPAEVETPSAEHVQVCQKTWFQLK